MCVCVCVHTQTGKTNTNGIVVNIGGVDVQFGGASGTSQFASKVPLPSQKQVQVSEGLALS